MGGAFLTGRAITVDGADFTGRPSSLTWRQTAEGSDCRWTDFNNTSLHFSNCCIISPESSYYLHDNANIITDVRKKVLPLELGSFLEELVEELAEELVEELVVSSLERVVEQVDSDKWNKNNF